MKNKGPSQRQLRVGELVRHALTDVLQRETLPSRAGRNIDTKMVSITEVRMTADLKIATCFVSSLGKGDLDAVIDALSTDAAFLRGRAAPMLNQMRSMPGFRFRPDTSFEAFAKIDAILKSDAVRRDVDSGNEPAHRPDTRIED